MNRRSVIGGLAAAVVAPLPWAVAAGNRQRVFEHSELDTVWDIIGSCRDLMGAQDRLRRWGPLPWTFTGNIALRSDGNGNPEYERVTVLIVGITDDEYRRIIGDPAAAITCQVLEPVRHSGRPLTRWVRYAR